jgi:hypothetical protein
MRRVSLDTLILKKLSIREGVQKLTTYGLSIKNSLLLKRETNDNKKHTKKHTKKHIHSTRNS